MYDALYQARSTAINGTSLDAFVPQIFGDVPVKVTRFIGSIPTVIGMGWVLFQGGDPSYPVWTGLDFSNDHSFLTTGIPTGGTSGQVLTKQSADNYVADWETLPVINTGVMSVVPGANVTVDSTDPAHPVVIGAYQIPVGGTTNQVLAKNSATDRDFKWFSVLPLAGGTLTGALTVAPSGIVPVSIGPWVGGSNYNGLMDGASGQYLIMTNGVHTYVSAPATGGTLVLRPGINDGHTLTLLPSGAHTLTGDLAMTGNLSAAVIAASGALSSGSFATGGASFSSGITFTSGGEIVHINVAGAYMRWFNGGASIGYLQGNAGGMLLNSDGGILGLAGNGGINFSGGRMDFAGQALNSLGALNGYTLSTGVIVNRVVLADGNGYIYGNYINMTADLGSGWPAYLAGRNSGDTFMRWYNVGGAALSAGRSQFNASGSPGAWYNSQVILHESQTASANNAGIAFYCNNNAWAPFFRCFGDNAWGERLDAVNQSAGYTGMGASSYNVYSTLRSKDGIQAVEDADLLDRLANSQAKRWMPKDVNLQIRHSDRFKDLNKRWKAKGRSPLTPQLQHAVGSEPHNCAEHDNCDGDADNPCMMARNWATGMTGLIAEEHNEHFPEHITLDAEGIPYMIDTSQVAATALGGLGAVVRYVRSLEARLAVLEGAV